MKIGNFEVKNYTQMRLLSFVLTILLFSQAAIGQSEKWKQKNARINFAITPQAEYVKTAGVFSPNASLSAAISFNSTYFLGGYLTKKVMRNYTVYDYSPGTDLDADFQHGGLEFLYAMKFGLYRTKGGHYVHPKIKILFGARLGVGMVWLDDINKTRFTRTDYFGYLQPMVGVAYPLNDFITVQGGFCGTSVVKIQVLDRYVGNMDFTMAGAYLGFRFNIFR